jgi:hypothetical protein
MTGAYFFSTALALLDTAGTAVYKVFRPGLFEMTARWLPDVGFVGYLPVRCGTYDIRWISCRAGRADARFPRPVQPSPIDDGTDGAGGCDLRLEDSRPTTLPRNCRSPHPVASAGRHTEPPPPRASCWPRRRGTRVCSGRSRISQATGFSGGPTRAMATGSVGLSLQHGSPVPPRSLVSSSATSGAVLSTGTGRHQPGSEISDARRRVRGGARRRDTRWRRWYPPVDRHVRPSVTAIHPAGAGLGKSVECRAGRTMLAGATRNPAYDESPGAFSLAATCRLGPGFDVWPRGCSCERTPDRRVAGGRSCRRGRTGAGAYTPVARAGGELHHPGAGLPVARPQTRGGTG